MPQAEWGQTGILSDWILFSKTPGDGPVKTAFKTKTTKNVKTSFLLT